jgi:uncharacterized protein YceK
MVRAIGTAAILVIPILMVGCGTVVNFVDGRPEVYGGVQKDIKFIETPPKSDDCVQHDANGPAAAVAVAFVFADVGVSAVADTLTLPLVVYMRQDPHDTDLPGAPSRSVAGSGDSAIH